MATADAKRVVRPLPVSERSYFSELKKMIQWPMQPARRPGSPGPAVKRPVLWVKFDWAAPTQTFSRNGHPQFLLIAYDEALHLWDFRNDDVMIAGIWPNRVECAKMLKPSLDRGKHDLVMMFYSPRYRKTVNFLDFGDGNTIGDGIKLSEEPQALDANDHVLVISVAQAIHLYNLKREFIQTIAHFPSPVRHLHPMALGAEFFAFPTLEPLHVGGRGIVSDTSGGMVTFMKYAHAIGDFSKQKAADLINGPARSGQSAAAAAAAAAASDATPGIVEIIDSATQRRIAHFRAHEAPLALLQFDPSGHILATADTVGQEIHIFHLARQSGPRGLSETTRCDWTLVPRHLYTLQRGVSPATICSIKFSIDSRWVAVTSARGTTHLFAINPLGDAIDARTHASPYIPNRSRFHTTSGIIDLPQYRGHKTLRIEKAHAMVKYPPHQMLEEFGPPQAVVFGSMVSTSPSSGSCPLITLFVAASTGVVVEHHLRPFGPSNNPQILQKELLEYGGMLIDEQTLARLSSLIGNFVPGRTQAAQTQSTEEAKPNAEKHFVGAPLSMLCAAIRSWDVCATEGGAAKSDSSPPGTAEAVEKPAASTAGSSTISSPSTSNSSRFWLKMVEVETYAPPHRRLWMGPQFQFKHFRVKSPESERRGRPIAGRASSLATPEKAASASDRRCTPLYFSDLNVVETRHTRCASAADDEPTHLSIDLMKLGSPWPSQPLVEHFAENELKNALEDSDSEDLPDSQDELSGDVFHMDLRDGETTPKRSTSPAADNVSTPLAKSSHTPAVSVQQEQELLDAFRDDDDDDDTAASGSQRAAVFDNAFGDEEEEEHQHGAHQRDLAEDLDRLTLQVPGLDDGEESSGSATSGDFADHSSSSSKKKKKKKKKKGAAQPAPAAPAAPQKQASVGLAAAFDQDDNDVHRVHSSASLSGAVSDDDDDEWKEA